jgi:1-acyl-sn-glycerol-3-phosphate acyltransferase
MNLKKESKMKLEKPLHFIEPKLNINFKKILSFLFPIYKFFSSDVKTINVKNLESLAKHYSNQINHKTRLLIAFRHPNAQDPVSLAHLFWKDLPKELKRLGIQEKDSTHFHFVWDRGIPLWAGEKTSFIYSRLGGIPIHRGKLDRKGLNKIREIFNQSKYPILIAPEGATNGHNETISAIEPGISQILIWGVEDLKKQNRNEEVILLCLGIKYEYQKKDWVKLEHELDKMKIDLGNLFEEIDIPKENFINMDENQKKIYKKLIFLYHSTLSFLEKYFFKYHRKEITLHSNSDIENRIQSISDSILSVEEEFFNVQKKGNIIDRCRKLEQSSWDYIYREDIEIEKLARVEKGVLDRLANESKLQDWNMRIVESLVAIKNSYLVEKPSFERFADMTLLLYDTSSKLIFGTGQKRPNLGDLNVNLEIGEEILVSEYKNEISEGRKSQKLVLEKLNQKISENLEKLV